MKIFTKRLPPEPPPNPVADLIHLVAELQQRIYRLENHHKGELPPLPPNPIEAMRNEAEQ